MKTETKYEKTLFLNGIFSFLVLINLSFAGSAYGCNYVEAITTQLMQSQDETSVMYSFGKFVYHANGANAIDNMKWEIETNWGKYHSGTWGDGARVYYVNEGSEIECPARFQQGALSFDFAMLEPLAGGDDDTISFAKMGLATEIAPYQTSDNPIILSFSGANAISRSLGINSSDLIGKSIDLSTKQISSKTRRTDQFTIVGICTKSTSAPFEQRYGIFFLSSKNTRITYFGCNEADFVVGHTYISAYTSISFLETLVSPWAKEKSTKVYSQYYCFLDGVFSSSPTVNLLEQIHNSSLASVQAKLKVLSFFSFSFLLFGWVFCYKKRLLVWTSENDEKRYALTEKESYFFSTSCGALTATAMLCLVKYLRFGLISLPAISVFGGLASLVGYIVLLFLDVLLVKVKKKR